MGRSSLHDNAGTLTPVGCVEPPNSPEQLLHVTRRGNNYLSRHCYQHIRETDAELRSDLGGLISDGFLDSIYTSQIFIQAGGSITPR